ncbi:DUF1392 family protein [Nostoc mirabile]|uniref:DUF1392 family protein n=1 Tax=Nostoc mirabile TaxID=2907820 RepID=UPI0022780B2E|nr:DUF1392 family protein [Nostoc mirabile]
MTYLVQNLEQCWYISPPWGQRIPPLLVSLLERVYVKSAKAFGYCTGVEWSERGWKYEIFTLYDNITWKVNLLAHATYNRTLKKNLCFDSVSWSNFGCH